MTADTGSLTIVLEQFLQVFRMGRSQVAGNALSLLTTLAAIELIIASLWWVLSGQDVLVGLIKKILTVGFLVFVIENYDALLHTVIEGFIQTGKTASSSGGDALASVRDPSTIIKAGFFVALPVLEHLQSFSEWDVLFHIHDIIITGLCGIGILAAYFIIAIQVFVTYLEFAIVSTLGLIFIPFGVLRHTRFLAEKAFGSIVAFGVKLMVLGLLVSVTIPVLKSYSLPADPTWPQLFNMLVLCFAVAGLAWHAPGVAAGMLSGGPSLSAATASGTVTAGAAVGANSPLAAQSVVHPPLSTAVTATKQAATALPLAHAGYQVAAHKAALTGRSAAGQLGAGIAGAGKTVASHAAHAAASPAVAMKENFKSFFESNQMRVAGFEALRAKQRESSAASISQAPQGKILKDGVGEPRHASLKETLEKTATEEQPRQANEAKEPSHRRKSSGFQSAKENTEQGQVETGKPDEGNQ